MWDYSKEVMQHFLNPRHTGQIESPDLDATVGNITCGDALRLMMKLDENGRIAEAKFQTFGCASAIASSDALIDLVIGKTVEEAARISNRDIAEYLGGLPEEKMHCSVMGMEALQKAIAHYRQEPFEFEDEGHVVCQCFGVTDKLIEKVVREQSLTTLDEVTHFTKAGGGCGACHGKINDILARVRGEMEETPTARQPESRRLTNLQKMRMIEEIIEAEIRPIVQADGGDVELVDIIGNRVQLAFRGSCAWCRARDYTADKMIGARLREMVDPQIVIEDLSQPLSKE